MRHAETFTTLSTLSEDEDYEEDEQEAFGRGELTHHAFLAWMRDYNSFQFSSSAPKIDGEGYNNDGQHGPELVDKPSGIAKFSSQRSQYTLHVKPIRFSFWVGFS